MELDLRDQTAVVTGATKGIGRAIAEALAAEGCHLHLAARTEADLAELGSALNQRFGVKITSYALDLTQAAAQEVLAARANSADILVNCAGNIPSGELDSFTDESWRAGWDLKVMGYINLTRLFYTAMKARGRGVIINVIGLAGVRMDAAYIAGSAGNAALIAFTRALGARSVDFGVRVVGVNPTLTDTPRGQRILRFKADRNPDDPGFIQHFLAGLPFGRMCTAKEIADIVAFLASRRAAYMSGAVIDVDGGVNARP
ncbi:MAG: short-chain dehydrogenase/reductase [Gammaproteobacteria bacterium]